MYNVMIFSHAFVVFMHTYHKVTTNSFQKNLDQTMPPLVLDSESFRNMHNLVWFLITDSGGFRFGLI